MFEDLEPRKKANTEFPRNLERLSVEDLADYINDLRAEITRVEQDMAKKKASRDAANSVFKS